MRQKGFTLIEVLVSVGIFAVVMVIALGALLAMTESNRRAEALKAVINNLNFALDEMSRSIRTGYNYHCGSSGTLTDPTPQDCISAGGDHSYFAYRAVQGSLGNGASPIPDAKIAYCLSNGTIRRQVTAGTLTSVCSSSNFSAITAPEVKINSLEFYVIGAEDPTVQPKVTVLITGEVQVSGTAKSIFNLQTTVTQRLYDR